MDITDYYVAVDESGGIEVLVDWKGQIIQGDHPIVLVNALLLKKSSLKQFESEWEELRKDIAAHTASNELPPIHLRLMYGRSLPTKYRDKPNPYLGIDFSNICDWIAKGLAIIHRYNVRRELFSITFLKNRRDLAESPAEFLTHPQFSREMALLRNQLGNKAYKLYHNMAFSALLYPLFMLIFGINEQLRHLGNRHGHIWVDPSPSSRGIDLLQSFNQMRELGHLECVSVERIEDADKNSLLQASDLVGFLLFRRRLMEYRKEEGLGHGTDPIVEAILQKYPLSKPGKLNIGHVAYRRGFHQLAQILHYEMAYNAVREKFPELAQLYLIDVNEFKQRQELAIKAQSGGISVLRNGEDHGLSRGPVRS